MQIEIIEKIEKRHIVQVGDNWPTECQNDIEKAREHLENAICNIGINAIDKKESYLNFRKIEIDGVEI